MDQIYSQILSIVTAIISGIDVTAIIGIIIYSIKQSISNRKAIAAIKAQVGEAIVVSRTQIEEAFKDAILPKNIKLDVSSKIEKPIREGLEFIKIYLQDELKRVDRGQQLILFILSQFSHINKLPEKLQQEITDYLEANTVEEIKL